MEALQDIARSVEVEDTSNGDKSFSMNKKTNHITPETQNPPTYDLNIYQDDLVKFLNRVNHNPKNNYLHQILQHLLQIDPENVETKTLKNLEDFVLTKIKQQKEEANATAINKQPNIGREPPVFQAPPPPPLKELFLPPPPPPVPLSSGPLDPQTYATLTKTTQETLLPQQNPPAPKAKMKIICWDKIPSHEIVGGKNLWTTLAKKHQRDPMKYIDWLEAESLFSLQTVTSNNTTLTMNRKSKIIKLLDSQKTFNIDILLEQFKGYKSDNDIVQLVYKGDHGVMGSEKISRLIKLLPEPEEIEILKNFEGNRDCLARAEKFLQLLIDVPCYKLRLECMSLKEDFKENVLGLQTSIAHLMQAGKDLMNNRKLHEVLFVIVLVGNFLNSGKYTGKAGGIRVASLLKLTNVRANANNMNFMHFIADQIIKSQADVLNFTQDLQSLEKVNKVNIEQLFADVKNLDLRLQHVRTQIESPTTEKDIKQQMMVFLLKADAQIDNLKTGVKNVESMHLQLCKFFCEDASKFSLGECFNTFQNFTDHFTSAVSERKEFDLKYTLKLKQRTSSGKIPHYRKSQFDSIPESPVAKDRFAKPKTEKHNFIEQETKTLNKENKEVKDIRNYWINAQNQNNPKTQIVDIPKDDDTVRPQHRQETSARPKLVISDRIQKYLQNCENANSTPSDTGSPLETPPPRTNSFRLKYQENPSIPKFEKIGKRVSSITEQDLQDIIQKLRRTAKTEENLLDIPRESLLKHIDCYHTPARDEECLSQDIVLQKKPGELSELDCQSINSQSSDRTPNSLKEKAIAKSTSSLLNTTNSGDPLKTKEKSSSLLKRLTKKLSFFKNTKGY